MPTRVGWKFFHRHAGRSHGYRSCCTVRVPTVGRFNFRPTWVPLVLLGWLGVVSGIEAAEPAIGVAVLHAAPWSPGDSAREGAGEFEVLLRIAQLQRSHRVAGLVSVGDRNGLRRCGGEDALAHAAASGIPVAKIAPGGEVAATPDALFLDAGRLDPHEASQVLSQCLQRHGPPPRAADPLRPTRRELAAIREHLRPFREALAIAAAPKLASR